MPLQRPTALPSAQTIEHLERGLRIDENALEDERRTQHDKFYVVAKQLALVVSRHDAAKNQLKEIDARTAETIRQNWDEPVYGRMTEKSLADKVLLHPEMIAVRKEVLQADLQVNLWEALKDAFEQRNDALDGLIRMHLSQHYGELRLDKAARQQAFDQETERLARLAQQPRRR